LSSFFQPFNAAITSSVARRAGLCGYFLYSAILTGIRHKFKKSGFFILIILV